MTPENREKILAEICAGSPKTCAAVYCGISRRTFHHWVNEDPDFAEAVEDAEATYCDSLRKKVQDGMNAGGFPDWRASAFLLERRDRKNYGKADAAASVTVNNTANLTIIMPAAQVVEYQQREKAALADLNIGGQCGRN